jgi:hypothetical protein
MAKKKNESLESDSFDKTKTKKRKLRKRATKEEKLAIKSGQTKVPPAYKIFWRSLETLWRNKKLLGGILVVYGVLDLLLVGAGVGNVSGTKSTLAQISHGHIDKIGGGLTLFSFLSSSTSGSSSSAAAGAYQTILLLLVSVVFIWALRQVYAGHAARVREAYYVGTYPIVPFILVLLIIGVQLLPLVAGGAIYETLVGGKIAVGAVEQILALLLFLALAAWSLYMISASVFALYIVTLPDMTPMKALRSARALVQFRRWKVLAKILFLPLALVLLAYIIVIPFALLVTQIATAVFLIISVLAVGVVHSYLYALYRELL